MADLKFFTITVILWMLVLVSSPFVYGASSSPKHIFILGGQSNMAGRGGVHVDEVTGNRTWDGYIPPESRSNPNILRFSALSKWELAREPLHRDVDVNKTNGICPGMAFGNEFLAKADKDIGVIGLVPTAIGGTYIREWSKGTENFTRLVNRIKASEETGGKVRGFFWLQGESDAASDIEYKTYGKLLRRFLYNLRTDLNRPDLPIIVIKITCPKPIHLEEVRRAQEAIKNKLPNVRVIDARRVLKRYKDALNKDRCHFNIKSNIQLGKMLVHAYLSTFDRELHQ